MAWFGWKSLKEAERYTRAANQKKLAASVVALMSRAKQGTRKLPFRDYTVNNKITTYTDYWREIALQDYADFARNEGSLRHAFHLAMSLSHMADWVFFGEEQSVRQHFSNEGRPVATEVEFGAALCAHLGEFAVIRGVANSAKHFQLRQGTVQKLKSHVQDAPSSSANTFSQSFDPWGGSWGSSWGSSWSQTRVQIEGTQWRAPLFYRYGQGGLRDVGGTCGPT